MAKLGEAWIEVRADLAKFPAALRTNLVASLKKAMAGVEFTALEDKAEEAGKEAAKSVGKGFETESKKTLKGAGKTGGAALLEGITEAFKAGGLLGALGAAFKGIGGSLVPDGGGGGDGAFVATLEQGFENIAQLLEDVLAQSVDLLGLLQSGFSSIFAGRGEQLREFFTAQYERVKDLWARLREAGREVFSRLFDEDSREWWNNFFRRGRDWFNDMAGRGRVFFRDLINRSRPFFTNLVDRGRSFFRDWETRHGSGFFGRLLTRGRGFFSRLGTQAASFASRLGTQIAGAFTSAAASVGPALSQAFGQIGTALSSIGGGLGAVLPIAGMAALIPVVVLLAGAIVQLGAALFALPAAIGVVLGAIAPLVIALSGVSEAVSAGFSGDVEKFNEALKGLAPSAQKVVKELVALKPQFDSIKQNVQGAFFQPLVGAFSTIGKTLLPLINKGLTQTASSLGHLARGVLDVFSRPENLITFQKLMASTNRVVQTLEPAFANLAQALLNLIAPALPFIERGTTAFRNFAATVEKFTDRISGDGTLATWLEKAGTVLGRILGVAKEFGTYLLTLLGGKIGDNGSEFLRDVRTEIEQINEFLKTKEGQEFINNLATGFRAVGKILTGLISLFPYIVIFFNAIVDTIRVIGRILEAIGAGAVLIVVAIGKFFAWLGTTIWDGLTTAADAVWKFLKGVGSAIADFFTKTIPGWWDAVVGFFQRLPGMVGNALKSFARTVWDGIVGAMEAVWTGFWRNVGRVIGVFLALPYLIETAVRKIPEILSAIWDQAWENAVTTWETIRDAVVGAVNAIPGLLASAGDAIAGFFTGLWDGIVSSALAVPGLLAEAGNAIATFFSDLWNGVVTDSYNAVVAGVNSVIDWFASIPGKIRALGPMILEAARSIGRSIADGLSSIGNFATDLGKKVTASLRSGINSIIGSINDGITDIDNALPVTLPRIPKLARGAIVDKPTLAQIGEAGREVVIPLTDPGRARQLAEQSGLFEVLGRGGGQAAPVVYLTAVLDGFGVLKVVDMRIDEKLDDQGQQLSYGPRGE
jgi:phage-related protein